MASRQSEIVLTVNGRQAERVYKSQLELVRRYKEDLEQLRLQGKETSKEFKELYKAMMEAEKTGKSVMKAYIGLEDVLSNLSGARMGHVQQAIKSLEKQWRNLNSDDVAGKNKLLDQLQKLKEQDALNKSLFTNFEDSMKNIDKQSQNTLRSMREYATTMKNYAVEGSAEWHKYSSSLDQIDEKMKSFGKSKLGQTFALQNPTGLRKEEIQEVIQELEKMKSSFQLWDTENISATEAKIQQLKNVLIEAEMSGIKLDEVISNPERFSTKQIEQAYNVLQTKIKSTPLDAPGMTKMKSDAEKLAKAIKQAGQITEEELTKILSRDLKKTPFSELEKAAERLAYKLKYELNPSQKEYAEAEKDYIRIRQSMDSITRSMENQGSKFSELTKRVIQYFSAYAGINMILTKAQQLISENLKLTDTLGDIRKTTGLANEEIRILSKQIDGLDTRTSQDALHQLAYEAGKLGIEGVDNIMQFVRAGNIIKVALGDDLGEDAIMQLMKLNNVMGLTAKMGLEKSLLSTGSALNELAASSEASGNYMVDFAARVSPVGRTVGWTVDQILALGATMEAMGQNAEMSATAVNKTLMNLEANALEVSNTLKINYSEFVELIRTKPVEAFRLMAEKAKEAGDEMGRSNFIKIFSKDLGSDEAVRMTQVLNAIIDGQDKFIANLFYGENAIRQATSATDEYSIKNETAAAIVMRMNNSIREFFINAQNATGGIGLIIKVLASLVKWLFDTKIGIELLAVAMTASAAAWTAFHIKQAIVTSEFIKGVKSGTTFIGMIRSLTTTMGGWITIGIAVGTAVYGLAKAYGAMSSSQQRAADTSKAFHQSVGKEISELNRSFESLRNLKEGTAEYNIERNKIIDKYSTLLGFQRDEIKNIQKQADLYEILRKRIIEKGMADAMSSAQTEANKEYWEEYGKQLNKVRDILSNIKLSDKTGKQFELTEEAINGFMNRISQRILSGANASSIVSGDDPMAKYLGALEKSDISRILFKLQKSYIDLNKEMAKIENLYGNNRTVKEDWKNQFNTLDEALVKYEQLKQKIKDIQKNPDKKDTALLNVDIDKTKKEIKEFEEYMTNVFDWKKQKVINKEAQTELERQKKLYQELTDIMTEYYTGEENKERERFLKKEITKKELDDRLYKLDRTHVNSRLLLYDAFLNKSGEQDNKELLKYGVTEKHLEATEKLYIKDANFRAELLRKQAEDMEKELQLQIKHQQAIQKIIADNNIMLKVDTQYQGEIQQLGLFNAPSESLDEGQARARLDILKRFASEAEQIDAEGLRKRMEQTEGFGEYVKNLSKDDYQALLILLRNYNVDMLEAETRVIEARRRLADRLYRQSDERQGIESENRRIIGLQQRIQQMNEIGATGKYSADQFNLEYEMTSAKIANLQREIEAREKFGGDVTALNTELTEEQMNLNSIYLREFKRQADIADEWGSTIGDGIGNMIAGTENAGQDLLKAMLKITVQMLGQMAQQMVMKQLIYQMDEAAQLAHSTKMVGIKAAETVAVGATETGKAIAQSYSQPDSVATFGASGSIRAVLLTGLISAGIAAAMALISSLFPSSTPNNTEANKKKLAPGMLTYADGNVSTVLGSDGQSYRAKHTKSFSTGIYDGPHYGIVGEKGPELIVSSKATNVIMRNHPEIAHAIKVISEHGSLPQYKVYAAGNVSQFQTPTTTMPGMGVTAEMWSRQQEINLLMVNTISKLQERLNEPIHAFIPKFGKGSLDEGMRDVSRFNKTNRRG